MQLLWFLSEYSLRYLHFVDILLAVKPNAFLIALVNSEGTVQELTECEM